MEQINLNSKTDNAALIGKTIKGISYLPDSVNYKPHLAITFTDNTYIYVEPKLPDDENIFCDCIIKNGYVVPLKCYAGIPGKITYDGKFVYYDYIEELIKLGIIEVSDDDRQKSLEFINENNKNEKERRYKQYLELKKEFETSN